MASTFMPSVTVIAAVVGALVGAILPTGLYLYVEPRGRLSWGTGGDTPRTRRAPALVRLTAWWSFAVGQLALPWLAVPAACAALLFLQAKLGVGRALGVPATVAVGGMALLQSLLAMRLLPLGVRLLARDPRLGPRLGALAKWNGLASGLLLGSSVALSWGMAVVPGLVHPWLRTALLWTALRPVMVYAAMGLLHSLLLAQCARVLVASSQRER
jgi:hypothetical protein